MKNTISRTLTESTVHAFSVKIENGEPVVNKLEPLKLYGTFTKEQAQKELNKKVDELSVDSITVTAVEEKDVCFEISIEKFIANATRIEPTTKKENE